jgi:hypothetical protein
VALELDEVRGQRDVFREGGLEGLVGGCEGRVDRFGSVDEGGQEVGFLEEGGEVRLGFVLEVSR